MLFSYDSEGITHKVAICEIKKEGEIFNEAIENIYR